MQDLRVIGVENGALLVASPSGERFRIPIDEVLQSRLKQSASEPGAGRKLSPREIQEQIRSGMSAEDVGAMTGMPVDYIAKYELPIIAEREHIVDLALSVPVHTAMDTGPVAGGMSFGTVIRSRLAAIGAINERWASWKEPKAGWVVKLAFTADQIDHDARWTFDPKRLALSPQNGEATTLSQQGDVPSALVPRLRAVASGPEPEIARFDSGAFAIDEVRDGIAREAIVSSRFPAQGSPQPLRADSNQTADLLDALRRRRGEREAASYVDEPADEPVVNPLHPSTGSIRIVDVPMPTDSTDTPPAAPAPAPTPRPVSTQPTLLPDFATPSQDRQDSMRETLPQPGVSQQRTGPQGKRKGRTSMPSWDDIVFGARPDDGA